MAIAKQDALAYALRNLDEEYRSVRDHMFAAGQDTYWEVAHIERVFNEREKELRRRFEMDYGDVLGQTVNSLTGLGMNSLAAQNQLAVDSRKLMMNAAMSQTQAAGTPIKPATEKEGVLFFRGKELPEKWLGAYYGGTNRAVVGKQWKISFTSDYSSDTIMLWLSTDQYSGNDADKVADTYREMINQRRLG